MDIATLRQMMLDKTARAVRARKQKGAAMTGRTKAGLNMKVMVISRKDPTAAASGKKGPVRINAYVVQSSLLDVDCLSVDVPIARADSGSSAAIANGDTIHLSSFNGSNPAELNFGVIAQLECVACTRVGDTDYFSAKSIKVLSNDTNTVLDSMPGSFFHLPSIDDAQHATVVLRFRGDSPQIESTEGAFLRFSVPDDTSSYLFDKTDEGTREIAFSTDFDVMQWGKDGPKDTVCIDTRFYNNHLGNIGITDPDTWMYLAPYVLSKIWGYVPGYIDMKRTVALDLNNPQMRGGDDHEHAYALSFKGLWNASIWNLPRFLKDACFEVSAGFVHAEMQDANTSEFSQKNPLSDPSSPIVNLSEYSGALAPFYESGGRFFLLTNHAWDEEDVDTVNGLSIAERELCLSKKPGCALKIGYSGRKTWVFFYQKPDPKVGDKRSSSS
jgi:hypothetical protein